MAEKMVPRLVGIEDASYTAQDGRFIVGSRIHVVVPFQDGSGYKASNYFVSKMRPSDFHLGDILTVTFDVGVSGKARCTGVIYA